MKPLKFRWRQIKRGMSFLAVSLFSFAASSATCPTSPTTYFNVSIPDPDPAPAAGEFPADLSQIMDYVNANNITTVRDFLSHMPLHLRKHYSFIKNTAALNVTSLQNPGLLPWGSDARFMMNIGSTVGSPLYDVVDLGFLQDDGDWEFRSLDFRGPTPVLSPDGGFNGECRQCHGEGSTGGVGSMRPILGDYLFWTGFFSNSNDQGGEAVTAEEKPILDQIKNGQHNMDRFHSLIYGDYLFAEVGTSNMLPDHAYGPGLTIFNTELAAAVTESLHKRMSRSPDYRGLREEMLLLSYCDGRQLSAADKTAAKSVVQSKGGNPDSFISYNSWAGVYQALGLDPMHEFPLDFRTQDLATATESDMNWNTGVSPVRESVDFLILMELAEENAQIASMLNNNPSSYTMTGSCSFNSLKEHFDHKKYALYTLHGNARQKARESYYDIDYHRIHSSMDYIRGPMCNLLSANIGPGTIGSAGVPLETVVQTSSSQGQHLAGGNQTPGNGMSLYTFDNDGANGSNCNGTCSSAWPPLTVEDAAHVNTSAGGSYGVVTRNDGKLQVTYNNKPLYFYADDAKAGDTKGHGQNGVWWLAGTTSTGNLPPVANANGPYSGNINSAVSFSSQGSNDPDGNIVSFQWNFGDGATSSQANPSHSYSGAGTYSVTLTVTDNGGATATSVAEANITSSGSNTIVAKPNGPYSGTVGNPVQFSSAGSDSPDGGIVEQEWDFGDGNGSSTSANPTYTYAAPGTYTVTLLVIDGIGNEVEATTTATITEGGGSNQAPVANANGPYSGNVNSNISFSSQGSVDNDGNIVSYQWSFGDGATSSQPNPSHAYSAAGNYTATLTVTDNEGATGQSSTSVSVSDIGGGNQPPVANANGPYSGSVNSAISFSSQGSVDNDGSIASYQWSFGDGGTSNQANPSHTYTSSGNFTATLTVTDNQGASAQASADVTVSGGANTIVANPNGPYSGTVGNAVQFSSAGSDSPDGGIVELEWDFGDGNGSSTSANPTYTYSAPGTYTVTLLVIDGVGNEVEATTTATITEGGGANLEPVAVVNGPYTGEVGRGVAFSSNGSNDPDGSIVAYNWNFGDGSNSTQQNPIHTYSTAGSYTVTLTVTDNNGLSGSSSSTATISGGGGGNQPPVAQMNGPYNVKLGETIAFSSAGSNDPDGSIVSYQWNFGDGASSNQPNPSHTYASVGDFSVTLTVTDDGGLTHSVTELARVTDSATALGNGVPVTIQGSANQELKYFIHIHGSNPTNLNIQMSGGSGDADLYVRQGALPTNTIYDCRPYLSGNNESCAIATPIKGPYYIVVKGYSAFSGVTLTATYDEGNTSTPNLVMIHNHPQHGDYLAGGPTSSKPGMSLYVFDNDQGSGGSSCNGSCATTWPPLTVSSPSDIVAPPGSGNLGTITRNDGSLQVTLDGRPLYFYINDRTSSDVTGHGASGTWWLATLSGGTTPGNNEYGVKDACALGRPAQSNVNIALGEAICTQGTGSGQVNFKYTPTSADVGKDLLFTIGHGSGIAGLTANQNLNRYATEADYLANPGVVFGSFDFDPLKVNRTYNQVIVPNVQAGKDIWISLNSGNGGFDQVALKGEVIVPVDTAALPDACAAGSPPITDQYVNLGQAVCGKSSPGRGYYTHFIYRPTAAEAGKTFLLEMAHGTGEAKMTVNQHYSSAPTSGGTAFAHEEHLSDRPDLVYSSFRAGVEQRVIYPDATANTDIFVVVPPGDQGFSNFTFRISVLPTGASTGQSGPTESTGSSDSGNSASSENSEESDDEE